MVSEGKALSLLGLAMRAGQVTSGGDMVGREVRAGRAALVLVDTGVSDRTRDEWVALCRHQNTPIYFASAGALGKSIGKDNRMIAAVRKGPLANQMATLLEL